MRNIGQFTIGCDAEIFVEEKGSLKSAIPIINGTKNDPLILENGAGLHHDNVCLEFAAPVSSTIEGFVDSILKSMKYSKQAIPKNFGFKFIASDFFTKKELNHPLAKEFGCEPDWNAWTKTKNPIPKPKNKNLRSCGAHVHIGFVPESGNVFLQTIDGRLATAKMCDAFLGIPSVLLDTDTAALTRRELYGKAGSHRPTEYGIEYRVLSNYWIQDEKNIKLVYMLVRDMLRFMRTMDHDNLIRELKKNEIENAINNCDQILASWLLTEYVWKHLYSDTKELLVEIMYENEESSTSELSEIVLEEIHDFYKEEILDDSVANDAKGVK